METTPDFFLGARLGAARAKAKITLEKAAADTRIGIQRLREIESDDFSGFSHPTYARLFLLDYAEYLGIPDEEVRPLLPDRAGAAAGGFQYIDGLAADIPAFAKAMKRRRQKILIALGAGLVLLLLLLAAVLTWFTIRKMERVARSRPIAELAAQMPEATAPTASPTPAPSATPAPPPEEAPEEFTAVGEILPSQENDFVETFEAVRAVTPPLPSPPNPPPRPGR
jgi:cytoskeleton protein RodZ